MYPLTKLLYKGELNKMSHLFNDETPFDLATSAFLSTTKSRPTMNQNRNSLCPKGVFERSIQASHLEHLMSTVRHQVKTSKMKSS